MLDLLESPKSGASDLLAALGNSAIAALGQRQRHYAGPERRSAAAMQ